MGSSRLTTPVPLEKDQQGNLWIGTTGDGLYQLTQGRFVAYTETNGLPSGEIRSLHADRDGSLWIGTAKGLCRIMEGRVAALTGKRGLPDEPILQLRSDDEGNLWLGTSSGIFRARKDQLKACAEGRAGFIDVVAYGKEDGLPGFQCLPEALSGPTRGGEGWSWFSTTKGLVAIPRRGLRWNTLSPPVVIEHVLVENEDVPLNGTVRVAPGKESFQFQYRSELHRAREGPIPLSTREGFDRDWSRGQRQPQPRVTRRPRRADTGSASGRTANDGVWNEARAEPGRRRARRSGGRPTGSGWPWPASLLSASGRPCPASAEVGGGRSSGCASRIASARPAR